MKTNEITTGTAKTAKATDLNAIFAKATQNLQKNVRQGATLYKDELFAGLSDKEKKARRTKLRKVLENFVISAKQSEKNAEKLQAIRKDWQEYAKSIYVNVENIVDANASKEKQEDIQYFLKQMAK